MNHTTDDRLPNDDPRLLCQRYVDGALSTAERTAFDLRLRAEPGLAALVADLRALRSTFVPMARESAPVASAGFRARVMALAAVAPESADDSPSVATSPSAGDVADSHGLFRLLRRCLVAAAILSAISLVFLSGVLRRADSGRLEASEAQVQKAMDALDARIKARASEPR